MISAIVLSSGKGRRFGGDIPKQYTGICGKPVVVWSLEAFQRSVVDKIILVCDANDIEFCTNDIIKKYNITKCTDIVAGGKERYNSVYAGLLAAKNSDYVLIHDGARPLIDTETINCASDYVQTKGSCVVGVPSSDTVQVTDEGGNITFTPLRANTWIAETPQCFKTSLALKSYEKAIHANDTSITDDAMVVLKYGNGKVAMLPGKKENIKLTTASDLKIMEFYLNERAKMP